MKLLLEECLRGIADEVGIEHSEIFRLLREILTGQEVSPPIIDVINILGREKVVERLNNYLKNERGEE